MERYGLVYLQNRISNRVKKLRSTTNLNVSVEKNNSAIVAKTIAAAFLAQSRKRSLPRPANG